MTPLRSLVARAPLAVVAVVAVVALSALAPSALAGTWTKLVHNPPSAVNMMMLLPNGTVMAQRTGEKAWYRLTPDSTGSYVNGTWTPLTPMIDSRLYYASQVLRDGRVFVAGGEYGTGGSKVEIYDPIANTWTAINPPAALWNPATDNFVDALSEVLSDGRVIVMPVSPHTSGVGLIYDPVANTWSNAGKLKHGSNEVEASWVKLPDDSLLVIDFFATTSERYITPTNTWINDANVPVQIYDSIIGEMGGALLLPNGKGFFLGATGHTALYTPTGTTSPGTWVAGPDFPAGQATPDAPCAMMIDGKMLCAVSDKPVSGNPFPSPTRFYEYDWASNSFAQVSGPTGLTDNTPPYTTIMLDLPNGQVLYTHMGSDVYAYTPSGPPLAAGKPAISGITQNGDGSWHLVGTGLNGISEGATYGDDAQMSSNYPLVRVTAGGVVKYLRTYGWSSTGVMTGATPVSTEFTAAGLLPGDYSLEVVANGIASDPVTFTVPDFATWVSLGNGLAGITGIPSLTGSGTQVAGQPAALALSNAAPSAPCVLFLGFTNNPTPFKGGMLVPVPAQLVVPFTTSPAGALNLPFTWPAGVPSGFSLYYQFAIQDGGAFFGVALSNALQSTTL